jgi:hypothetical protein
MTTSNLVSHPRPDPIHATGGVHLFQDWPVLGAVAAGPVQVGKVHRRRPQLIAPMSPCVAALRPIPHPHSKSWLAAVHQTPNSAPIWRRLPPLAYNFHQARIISVMSADT